MASPPKERTKCRTLNPIKPDETKADPPTESTNDDDEDNEQDEEQDVQSVEEDEYTILIKLGSAKNKVSPRIK